MIPAFPNFKNIDLEDKEDIEFYTHQHEPYSDFNFTSLWIWDIDKKRMVSKLNDNLVILMTDYEESKANLTFLGNNKPKETLEELTSFAKASKITSVLHYVPERSVDGLEDIGITIEEDVDNFDYVFSIPELAKLEGKKYKKKRHSAERFSRDYPNASFEIKKLDNPKIQKQILSLFHLWKDGIDHDPEHEGKAIERLFKVNNSDNFIVSCLFLSGKMIAFSVDEILPFNYVISHFCKADNSYRGVNEFFNKKLSQHLVTQGITFWNWEQDLGIENLRKAKESYRPVKFLKKYKI